MASSCYRGVMIQNFPPCGLYLILLRFAASLTLLARSSASKDAEVLALAHEVSALREPNLSPA